MKGTRKCNKDLHCFRNVKCDYNIYLPDTFPHTSDVDEAARPISIGTIMLARLCYVHGTGR
jgi:hypothetical protein